jgi:hypothetical protein
VPVIIRAREASTIANPVPDSIASWLDRKGIFLRGAIVSVGKVVCVSRSVDIEFEFEQMPTLADVLRTMRLNNIEFFSGGGLWVSTNGDHDWDRRDPRDFLSVMLEMTRTMRRNESVGFGVTWPAADRRGTVLLMPQFKSLSFAPDLDTLTHGDSPESIGLGWYVDTLSSALAHLCPTAIAARNAS